MKYMYKIINKIYLKKNQIEFKYLHDYYIM